MMEYGCVNLPDAWVSVWIGTGVRICLRSVLMGVRMISRVEKFSL